MPIAIGHYHIAQGAVVASKLLSGVVQQIKDKQAKEDSDKFDKLRNLIVADQCVLQP